MTEDLPPHVSVVIPLFNKERTIERALRSVAEQRFKDLEIVVVDDGGGDRGAEIAAAFPHPRLRVLRQENLGPGAARNRGARETTGRLLAFLDADDEWAPDFLEAAVARLHADPGLACYACCAWVGTERQSNAAEARGHEIPHGADDKVRPGWPERTKLLVNLLQVSCVVVRRDVFERYGGFYEKDRCLYAEDLYLFAQIGLNERFFLDYEPRAWFHTEDSALGVNRRGRHPIQPALLEPMPMLTRCGPRGDAAMRELLAYLRLIETERRMEGWIRSVQDLRRAFPWPRPIPFRLRRREARVTLRMWARPALMALRRGAKSSSRQE